VNKVPNADDVYGSDHPTIDAAIKAITFHGVIGIDEIDRDRAARVLDMWKHNPELTDRERAAVLSRFPETVVETDEVEQAYADGYVDALSKILDGYDEWIKGREVAPEINLGEAVDNR